MGVEGFSRATPKLLASVIKRLWWPEGVDGGEGGGASSSARILQDLQKCTTDHVLQIIAHKGTMVDGIGNRSGKRKVSSGRNWGGPRKKTAAGPSPWVHPDACGCKLGEAPAAATAEGFVHAAVAQLYANRLAAMYVPPRMDGRWGWHLQAACGRSVARRSKSL